MRNGRVAAAILIMVAVAGARGARAQSRPLTTESVDGPGDGNITVRAGADYARDVRFTLSGLGGDLWRIGLVRIDFGLSSIAEFDLSGGIRDHLEITSRTPAVLSDLLRLSNPSSTGAFDDVIVGTKLRLAESENGTAAIGVRVATRLPNAKHASGLGQNTTDFYSSLLVQQSIAALQFFGNIGYGILGDPLHADRHVGSLLYSAELDQRMTRHLSLLEGIDGRTGPIEPGLESRSIARAGLVWTRGGVRLELDGTLGLTSRDGNVGAAVQSRFTFHAFDGRP